MCKKLIQSLFGGGEQEMPAVQGNTVAPTTQAQVKDNSGGDPARDATGGSYVPQERKRGRLAGLGL